MHSVSTALGRVVICFNPMLGESWSFTPLQGILPGTSYCAILPFHPPQSASSSFSSSDHPQATITSCIDYRNNLLGLSLPASVLVPDYPIICTMTRVMSYKSTSDQMLVIFLPQHLPRLPCPPPALLTLAFWCSHCYSAPSCLRTPAVLFPVAVKFFLWLTGWPIPSFSTFLNLNVTFSGRPSLTTLSRHLLYYFLAQSSAYFLLRYRL